MVFIVTAATAATASDKRRLGGRQAVLKASDSTTASLSSRWYAGDSPWNTPIPANPPIVSESRRWMAALENAVDQINVNQGLWTPPVYIAPPGTPRQAFTLDNAWQLDDVPVPHNLAPSRDSDAHVIILDLAHGREYDFFALRKLPNGRWHAHAGVVFRLNGSGWWKPDPWAARASGAALGGGLIRGTDVKAGKIDHALAAALPKSLIADYPVSPAMTSDGGGGSTGIPMGSRLQLEPNLAIPSLGLEPGEEMIARAMQVYGIFVVDSSSAFALYAQNSSNLRSNPYPRSWSNGIMKRLIKRMRVVAPTRPPAYDSRTTMGQPHRLSSRRRSSTEPASHRSDMP